MDDQLKKHLEARSHKGISFTDKSKYYDALNMVIDPELGVGIADMGLIYKVRVYKGSVLVTMTLTTMGCPAGPDMIAQIIEILPGLHKNIKDVQVEVVWDPAWNADMMKPEIKDMLFGG
ncbi:metal-sulfur cluster assembly factor [Pseudomonadota bacterium]